MPTSIVICGALGRMGSTIGRLAVESGNFTVLGGVDVREGTIQGMPVVPASGMSSFLKEKKPDVVIDFTIASAAVENIRTAVAAGSALVVGTTGFSDSQRDEIRQAVSDRVPMVLSSNYSIGMNVFWNLVREAAKRLGEYDIEVIEAHHRYKKDAPSGTARTILQILEEEVGERKKMYGREGMKERGNEIGVHVLRGGDIVGDHSVMFAGNFETITLSHRAYDRSVFAKGALASASWVVGKVPGIYGMNDVLGLGK